MSEGIMADWRKLLIGLSFAGGDANFLLHSPTNRMVGS